MYYCSKRHAKYLRKGNVITTLAIEVFPMWTRNTCPYFNIELPYSACVTRVILLNRNATSCD